jgi:hypothetical protein
MTPGRAGRPLDGALDRHPAGRDRRRDLLRLARVVARRLEHGGAPHPAVGAAALASRGVRADDRMRRAAAWGLSDACLAAIEAGACPADSVPAPLRLSSPYAAVLDALEREGW